MTLNYIERMKCYNDLKRDYDYQKIENGKKQDRIVELSKENRQLKKEIEKIKEEFKNDRKITRGEHNTRNKTRGRKPSKQTKEI